jgi:hypothetical protein
VALLLAASILSGSSACGKGELSSAPAEVAETNIRLELPAVPEFKMPAPYPDGSHSVSEMRLQGNRMLESEVRVKGHVVWVYDCATALRTPEMTDKELKRILTDEPERCDRPNFYLGDAADTPVDKAIWVVEVPRAPREDEKKVLPKEELALWPAVPVFSLGQQVVVTGTWAQKSPKGFLNSDGLLVYKSLENLSAPAAPEK